LRSTSRRAPIFNDPAINVYSRDATRLVGFYEGLGFRETFRTPEEGTPIHVEVTLDGFTIGIADADSARADLARLHPWRDAEGRRWRRRAFVEVDLACWIPASREIDDGVAGFDRTRPPR
jgi:hypothetical protein